MQKLLDEYGIGHVKSTPYYPRGRSQAKSPKRPCFIFSIGWSTRNICTNFLRLVLWAYRTLKRSSTQVTPFSLVYWVEAMVQIEVMIHSARLALGSKPSDLDDRIYEIEALQDGRHNA